MRVHLLKFRIGQKQLVLRNCSSGNGAILDDSEEWILNGLIQGGAHGEVLRIELIQVRAVSVKKLPSLSSRIPDLHHRRVAELVLKIDTVALHVGRGMGAFECA